MKLTYTNVNGYLIPNLTYKSGEQMEQLGKYGFLRRDYWYGCAGDFGALLLGIGMSLCMVFGKMILGVVIGLVGIVALLMLIPLTKGLK